MKRIAILSLLVAHSTFANVNCLTKDSSGKLNVVENVKHTESAYIQYFEKTNNTYLLKFQEDVTLNLKNLNGSSILFEGMKSKLSIDVQFNDDFVFKNQSAKLLLNGKKIALHCDIEN